MMTLLAPAFISILWSLSVGVRAIIISFLESFLAIAMLTLEDLVSGCVIAKTDTDCRFSEFRTCLFEMSPKIIGLLSACWVFTVSGFSSIT